MIKSICAAVIADPKSNHDLIKGGSVVVWNKGCGSHLTTWLCETSHKSLSIVQMEPHDHDSKISNDSDWSAQLVSMIISCVQLLENDHFNNKDSSSDTTTSSCQLLDLLERIVRSSWMVFAAKDKQHGIQREEVCVLKSTKPPPFAQVMQVPFNLSLPC